MNFILENYLVFVLIGLFLIFALIGYVIDMVRKNNNDVNTSKGNEYPSQIESLNQEVNNLNSINMRTEIQNNNIQNMDNNFNNINQNIQQQIQSVPVTNINNNDELLNSYNNTNTEQKL